MDEKAKDILRRAGHTFWQAGLASLPATIPLDMDTAEGVTMAFLAAGGAAVLSLIKGMVKARQRTQKGE